MKYSPKDYAQAYRQTVALGVNESVAGKHLRQNMEKNGDKSRADAIVRELEKLLAYEVGGRVVRVEFARAQNAETRKNVLSSFSNKDRVTTTVNPDLIAGLRINYDDEQQLDVSLFGKLKELLG